MERTMTITEALAELRTISKRIEAKDQFIRRHCARLAALMDPLTKEGGSEKLVAEEMQAVSDLHERIGAIRHAIARSNEETVVDVGDSSMTVARWLVWRREVAPKIKAHLQGVLAQVAHYRRQAEEVRKQNGDADANLVVNIREAEVSRGIESIDTILGELDGRLTLSNSVTTITV